MPDYIYLLENRLSRDQQSALRHLREAAREAETILFLTGDAVRELTNGNSVRSLEVSVHGNALNLKKTIEKLGGSVWGQDDVSKTLYLCFPGTVRVDVISTHRAEYPKPGQPVIHSASIQEDLRRRDFTVNAMAISLNEGSFGLLMDPMNGVADIESKTLRLVSNYGFLDDPALLIRATRYRVRLGWEFDPRTNTRYDNAREEGVIEHLSAEARSQELEQIGHEEQALKVLRALEAEGWMQVLFPAWASSKADEEKLIGLHALAGELLAQGVHADMSAAQMQLLTAGLATKDRAALKKLMLRPGFVAEWNNLDAMAAEFAKVLMAAENSTPSACYKLFTTYDPEAILWLGFTSKEPTIQERFNLFLKVWPETRQRIPHALMQEMRITPELPAYPEIVQAIFLELIDGRLSTTEELRTFLEPHSPPAPPPKETIKRPRAKRGAEAKVKEHSYDDEDSEDELDEDDDLDDIGGDDDDIDLGLNLPKVDLDAEMPDLVDSEPIEGDESESAEEELESEESVPVASPVKRGSKIAPPAKPAKKAPVSTSEKSGKPAPSSPAVKPAQAQVEVKKKPLPASKPKPEAKPAPVPAKSAGPAGKKAQPAKLAAHGSKVAKPVAKATGTPSKGAVKTPVKAKAVALKVKSAPVKSKPAPKHSKKTPPKPSKAMGKKPVSKPAKKR